MKSIAIVAAAALAVASVKVGPGFAGNALKPAGPFGPHGSIFLDVQPDDVPARNAHIEGLIANATQDAMTPKDMAHLVTLFPNAVHQRIEQSGSYRQGYGDDLDQRIQSLAKSWQDKYGHPFMIANNPDVMTDAFVTIQTPADNNPGPESATAILKGADGAEDMRVPFVAEQEHQWKIDVPANLTADQLRANLSTELGKLNDEVAKWPANETDAYRVVARHVMRAVLSTPAP